MALVALAAYHLAFDGIESILSQKRPPMTELGRQTKQKKNE